MTMRHLIGMGMAAFLLFNFAPTAHATAATFTVIGLSLR